MERGKAPPEPAQPPLRGLSVSGAAPHVWTFGLAGVVAVLLLLSVLVSQE
ncbi:MAG TPA: hypothetical protein VJS85_10720 [Rhizomicrobium sp.]|nr:hypothetical protein [Rhizomicrobium sp.]